MSYAEVCEVPSKKEEVFDMPLVNLGLSSSTMQILLRSVDLPHGQAFVRDIIESFGVYDAYTTAQCCLSVVQERFVEALVGLGLTRLDWPFLPQHTITDDVLGSLSKQELLDLPVVLLGTLVKQTIEMALDEYRRYIDRGKTPALRRCGPLTFKVAHLLCLHPKLTWANSYQGRTAPRLKLGGLRSSAAGLHKTWNRLSNLGLTIEDGDFMIGGWER